MLNDAYFATLDDFPDPAVHRFETVPLYAQDYEKGLRRVASWWSDYKRVRRHSVQPVIKRPSSDQFQSFPLWLQDWLRTLEWEVTWQRDLNVEHPIVPSRAARFNERRKILARRGA